MEPIAALIKAAGGGADSWILARERLMRVFGNKTSLTLRISNPAYGDQSLVGANEPEKALECFDEALGLQPKHAEALVKKGGALEKLGRLDEAIACYDRALEANDGMTIAYLHKGGLFNRMARYDEALQCYEQALRTQEKKTPVEKAAA